MTEQPIILFDGVCNFCNSAVNFTLKRNKKANIMFAPMQSGAGAKILQQYNLDQNDMKSFIFIDNGVVYKQSTGALRVCKYLQMVRAKASMYDTYTRCKSKIFSLIWKRKKHWYWVHQKTLHVTVTWLQIN